MTVDNRIAIPVIDSATCIGSIAMSTMVSKTQPTTTRFAVDMIDKTTTTSFGNLKIVRFCDD